MSRAFVAALVGCSLALVAAGCNRQAGKPARTVGSSDVATSSMGSGAASDAGAGMGRVNDDGPAYKDGKPSWAANRRHTAEENIDFQFRKNGADFGARSADDYVAKVHAFVDSPPSGVQTATRERNGDKLIYDPSSNTFAVVSRRGAPKTMFKPRAGKEYWTQQQAHLNDPRRGRGDRGGNGGASNSGSDDNG